MGYSPSKPPHKPDKVRKRRGLTGEASWLGSALMEPTQDDQAPDQAAAPQPPEPSVDPEQEGRDAEVIRLESDLAASRKRVDELARAFQALDRDREDFKQRLVRERERMIDVEKGVVAVTILEAVDELDLVISASGADESPLAKGVRLVRDGILKKVLASGIERLTMVGQPYDPNLAEAADMELTSDPAEDQKVISELRAGYRYKDKVIRPARVKVAKYLAPAQA